MLLLSSNRWYPINNFEKWKREVGENGLKAAFEELCRPVEELASPQSTPVKKEEGVLETKLEIIDLTMDEDVKPDIGGLEVQAPVSGPSRLPEGTVPDDPFQRILQSDPNALDLEFFGEDDAVMTLEQLLDRMTVDQLKQLAKQNKVAAGSKPKVVFLAPRVSCLEGADEP
jgi:Fanconi-associated nuclease 1